MSAVTDHNLISVGDYARRIDVSEQTVRRWIKQGLVPAVRVGPRLLRIEEDAPLPVLPSGERGSRPTTGRLR